MYFLTIVHETITSQIENLTVLNEKRNVKKYEKPYIGQFY